MNSTTETVIEADQKLPVIRMARDFAATPEQEAKRPGAKTQWRNLTLAGDWTATGLPACIEGAVRSGQQAAELALGRGHV